jgi:hypothetical protein
MNLFRSIKSMDWSQWLILVTGPTAIYFSQADIGMQAWACILGLVGQVGWFYTLYRGKQWGAFISCFAYTYAWSVGLIKYWIGG